jgi:heterodisulfide reductase subunit C
MGSEPFEYNPQAADVFTREVMARSGQNLTACYQCKRCASGCPVAEDTGMVTPNRLIRMVVLGDIENSLTNKLTWKCLFCHTCGTRCPNNIWGRINEIGMMGEFQLRNMWDHLKKGNYVAILSEIISKSTLAWKMFKQKRLHLSFHSSKGRDEISRLYKKSAGRKWI